MDTLLAEIFERQPIFANIMHKYGDSFLADYVATIFSGIKTEEYFKPRYAEAANVVSEILSSRLGMGVAKEVADQLVTFPLVSTMDHHALIQHPFWVNTNLVTALGYAGMVKKPKYLVVFTFSSISLNNASAYARGLLLHGGKSLDEPVVKIPLITEKYKMASVYGFPGVTQEGVSRAEVLIKKATSDKQLELGLAEQLLEWLPKTFAPVLNDDDLCSQVTKLNFVAWPALVKEAGAMPHLVYVEIESIVTELLLRTHLQNVDSPIYKLLFTTLQEIVKELFGNIRGSFGKNENWGTYFFWERKNYSRQATFSSKTPSEVVEGLREGTLFPNMLLSYLVVALYSGFNCLGGFCQVSDLTVVKVAWQKFLRQIGNETEAEKVAQIPTQLFGGDGMVFATLPTSKGEVAATGVDLLLRNDKPRFGDFENTAKSKTLLSMIAPMIPEIHGIITATPR